MNANNFRENYYNMIRQLKKVISGIQLWSRTAQYENWSNYKKMLLQVTLFPKGPVNRR